MCTGGNRVHHGAAGDDLLTGVEDRGFQRSRRRPCVDPAVPLGSVLSGPTRPWLALGDTPWLHLPPAPPDPAHPGVRRSVFFGVRFPVRHLHSTTGCEDQIGTLISEATASKEGVVGGVAVIGHPIPVPYRLFAIRKRPKLAGRRGRLRPKEAPGDVLVEFGRKVGDLRIGQRAIICPRPMIKEGRDAILTIGTDTMLATGCD